MTQQPSFMFYLAASYPRRAELQVYAEAINAIGHYPNCRWVFEEHRVDPSNADEMAPDGKAKVYAVENIQDLANSHAVLFFSSSERGGGTIAQGRGGRHTEVGMALALCKPIYMIGERENIFQACIPQRRKFYSFPDFIIGRDFVASDLAAHLADWPMDATYKRRVELLLNSTL